jgi:hypothetical protein
MAMSYYELIKAILSVCATQKKASVMLELLRLLDRNVPAAKVAMKFVTPSTVQCDSKSPHAQPPNMF